MQNWANFVPRSGKPSVLTIHGILERDILYRGRFRRLRSEVMKQVEMRARERVANLIVVSPYVRDALGGTVLGRTWDIDNPVADRFFEVERRPIRGRILFAGRLTPLKNLPGLIEAFALLARNDPHAELRVAGGDGGTGHAAECGRLAADLGVSGRVAFLGPVDAARMKAEFSQASCLALCSFQENAPLVVSEAMAAGVPVVASRVGGIPSMVEDGQTGRLVDPRDHGQIARALAEALDPEQWRGMVGAGAQGRAGSIPRRGRRAQDPRGLPGDPRRNRRRPAPGRTHEYHRGRKMMQPARNAARWALSGIAGGLGLTARHAARRRLGGRWGIILGYHRVIPADEAGSPYRMGMGADLFEAQIRWIASRHRIVSMEEFLWWRASDRTPPDDLIILTFDDGYRDNLTQAAPLLKELGIPALFYVTSSGLTGRMPYWPETLGQMLLMTRARSVTLDLDPGSGARSPVSYEIATPEDRTRSCLRMIESLRRLPAARIVEAIETLAEPLGVDPARAQERTPRLLGAGDIRALIADGFAIGSHSVSHPYLPSEEAVVQRREIEESRRVIEEAARIPRHRLLLSRGRLRRTDAIDGSRSRLPVRRDMGYRYRRPGRRSVLLASKGDRPGPGGGPVRAILRSDDGRGDLGTGREPDAAEAARPVTP